MRLVESFLFLMCDLMANMNKCQMRVKTR